MSQVLLSKRIQRRKQLVLVCLIVVCLSALIATLVEWQKGFPTLTFLAYYPLLGVNLLAFYSIQSKHKQCLKKERQL